MLPLTEQQIGLQEAVLVPPPRPLSRSAHHEHVDVLIVGAGVAGLTAAHRLLSQGQRSLLVLEAADYAGGRVKAVPWGEDGVHLNVGAHWVAGDGPGHPMQHLLQAALTALPEPKQARCKVTNFDPENIPMFSSDGRRVPYDWAPLLAALERMEEREEQRRERQQRLGSSDGGAAGCAGASTSAGLWHNGVLDKPEDDVSLAEALAVVGWRPDTEADRAAMWLFSDYEWGTPASATPLKHTVPAPYYLAFGSDKQRLMATDGGTPDLLAPLLQQAGPHVRLGERVTSIVQHLPRGSSASGAPAPTSASPTSPAAASASPSLVTVTTTSTSAAEDGSAAVTTTRTYSASAVILTASLGVLASHAIRFEPPLPVDKLAALARHKCMADYEVVVAEFTERFWARHMPADSMCMLYTGSPRMILHDLSCYFEDGRPLLEFHLAGEDAVRVSNQPLEQTREELVGILRRMFGADVGADAKVLEPTKLVCTNWGANSLTRGSFSIRPLGLTEEEQDSIMRPYGSVFFAGDDCHHVHSGYLHAAYLSGIDTADNVAKHVAKKRLSSSGSLSAAAQASRL